MYALTGSQHMSQKSILYSCCFAMFLVIFTSVSAGAWTTIFAATSGPSDLQSIHQGDRTGQKGLSLYGLSATGFQVLNYNGGDFSNITNSLSLAGSPDFWGGLLTPQAYNFLSLARTTSGTTCLAYTVPIIDGGYTVQSTALRVGRLDGSSWTALGPESIVSSAAGDHNALVHIGFFADDVPMLLWTYKSSNCENLFAARWDGANWQPMGAGAMSEGDGIAGSSVLDPVLAVGPDGLPVAVYCDFSVATNPEIRALRWDGSNWTALGGDQGNISQSANFSMQPTAVFDEAGTLHVAWAEFVGVQDYPAGWWIKRQPHGEGMTHADGLDAVLGNLVQPTDASGTLLEASTSWNQGQWRLRLKKYVNGAWVAETMPEPDYGFRLTGQVTSAHMLSPRLAVLPGDRLALGWETWLVTGTYPFELFVQFPHTLHTMYRQNDQWMEIEAGDATTGLPVSGSQRLREIAPLENRTLGVVHAAGVLRSASLGEISSVPLSSLGILLLGRDGL